jgi:hypothetical protein
MLDACILEAFCLFLCWDNHILKEVFRVFPPDLQSNAGIVSQLEHNHFFLNPFQLILIPSSDDV